MHGSGSSRPPNQDQNARVTRVDIGAQSSCGQCIVCCACSAIAGDSGRKLCFDIFIPINTVKRLAFFAESPWWAYAANVTMSRCDKDAVRRQRFSPLDFISRLSLMLP
ncbi:hypothetical protein L1887_51480 [Cichorium endivia]|nr:hypothetical protein L1887_51480 [Cichorium endivia]